MTVLDFIRMYACQSGTAEVRIISKDERETFVFSDFEIDEVLEDYAGLLKKKIAHFDIVEDSVLVIYGE